MSELLTDIFHDTVRSFGNWPAVVEPKRFISCADLDSRSDEIATTLRRLGIRPGARIGIFRRKNIETVASIYGVLKAGCAYVPIDSKIGLDRLAAILNDAGLAALFIEPVLGPRLQAIIARGLCPWLGGPTTHREFLRSFN